MTLFLNADTATFFRGFQLYWNGGGNFSTNEGGSITVYGYKE